MIEKKTKVLVHLRTEEKELANEMAEKYGRGEKIAQGEWEFLEMTKERDDIFADVEPGWWKGSDNTEA